MTGFYDFEVSDIHGQPVTLDRYRGQVVLVVNTASRCGLTPQYAGLEDLNKRYSGRGLAVLGFPCNQFREQEPGDAAEIESFCSLNYGVTFPLFAKVEVNGEGAAPLWKWLKGQKRGFLGSASIKWNFTKFLLDRQGRVVKRYGPQQKPEAIAADIERLL